MKFQKTDSTKAFFRYPSRLASAFSLIVLLAWPVLPVKADTPAPPPSPPLKVSIPQAVREAIDNNLGLLAERYNVTQADAQMITARLRPNPVLTVDGDFLDTFGSGFFRNRNSGAGPTQFDARVDFPIERGHKREFRMEVARNAKSVAELNLLNSTRNLVIDVERACIEVLASERSLALAQQNLKSFNDIVAVNAVRVQAGDLAPVELVRTRIAALQLGNAVTQAQSRLRTAKNHLQLLLGRARLDDDFEITDDFRQDTQAVTFDGLLDQAFQLRPDLQALKSDQARNAADIKLQIAQGKVDYSVGVAFHRQQNSSNSAGGSSLGVFFSVPLPVFNRNQGEIARVKQEQLQIETRINALQNNIRDEVQDAFQRYRTARTLLDGYENGMLEQARNVLTTTEYSYRRGEANFLEFLDAQRAFNDTTQGYIEARAEYARVLYELDSITGKAAKP